MKKILIVDVPEDYTEITITATTKKNPYFVNFPDFTEFTPPSDEEIDEKANELYLLKSGYDQEYNDGKHAGFIEGSTWFKSLLQ